MSAASIDEKADRHRNLEDLAALVTGSALAALGVSLLKAGGIVTGGASGLALLVHYALGASFEWAFAVINVPFYLLSARLLGLRFTIKSLGAVVLLLTMTGHAGDLLRLDYVSPLYSALMGGVLLGVGFLILFRHKAGVGAVGIVVFYLHGRFGWRTGIVQMAIDLAILGGSSFFLPPRQACLSLLAAGVLNLVLFMNHKPSRYIAG